MDTLKSAWQAMPEGNKPQRELQRIILENRHPVQQQVRRQVILESILFSAFLACYYTMFDGDRKPLLLNGLLVCGVLLIIGYGLLSYFNAARRVMDEPLRAALNSRLRQIKTFAVLSVTFRVTGMACILLYFVYGIAFTMEKQALMLGAALVVLVQFSLLVRLWARRIRRLGEAAEALSDQ